MSNSIQHLSAFQQRGDYTFTRYKPNAVECLDDKRLYHCISGPAIERINRDKKWQVESKLHRLDGPAVECNDSRKYWFVHRIQVGTSTAGYTQKDFENYKKEHNITSSKFSQQENKHIDNTELSATVEIVIDKFKNLASYYNDIFRNRINPHFSTDQKIAYLIQFQEFFLKPTLTISDSPFIATGKNYIFSLEVIPYSSLGNVNITDEFLKHTGKFFALSVNEFGPFTIDLDNLRGFPDKSLLKDIIDFLYYYQAHYNKNSFNFVANLNIVSSEEIKFDYDKERENKHEQFEPDLTPGLSPLDEQQSYYVDFFTKRTDNTGKDVNWEGRENLQFWANLSFQQDFE